MAERRLFDLRPAQVEAGFVQGFSNPMTSNARLIWDGGEFNAAGETNVSNVDHIWLSFERVKEFFEKLFLLFSNLLTHTFIVEYIDCRQACRYRYSMSGVSIAVE
ncbi:hypothetical protein SAMN03159391_03428 [Pseudomonas sp. NFACC37-1]|nr:hypothetical protein SAMN03159391_03428 [Pseudomonas sp. NFACC37-1]SFO48673.1 hypothetical protein SAMN03159304_03582 [Pseudomonas sp. NFACC24-1]